MSREQNNINITDDDIIDEPVNIGDKKQGDAIIHRFCIYNCPTCGTKYRLKTFKPDVETINNVVSVPVVFPCSHSFVLMFDNNGKVRSHTEIRQIQVIIEKIDIGFLRVQEKKLIELHKRFVDERQDVDAFKIHERLKEIRQEISRIERDATKK